MRSLHVRDISIRRCTADEYSYLGRMLVQAYAGLPGMPQPHEQPDYYDMLADVARRDRNPSIRVFVAANQLNEPVGSIDFIDDMKHYGSAGTASSIANAAGLRLLAVRREWRGEGIGKALTSFCVEHARALHKSSVILHTTHLMRTAWSMYARMGFERFPEIDFQQGSLDVFGFRLGLS